MSFSRRVALCALVVLVAGAAAAAAQSGTATLTLSVKAGLAHGTRVQGWITLTGGGDTYQLAYWAQVAP